MLTLCGLCGADLSEGGCGCRREAQHVTSGGVRGGSQRPGRSLLIDVCLTAALTRGRVDEQSLGEASAVLREDPS